MTDAVIATCRRFVFRKLTVVAYTNGFTSFVYRDRGATIAGTERPNFFFDAADMLAVGDIITIVAQDGVRAVWVAQADTEAVVVKGLV